MHRRISRHLLLHSNPALANSHHVGRASRTHRQRNFAVPARVSSDTSEVKKSQKRVPREERRSMVEAFVNKYRAMNSGNFPSAPVVQKEVGGSYYIVRDIVQELQYKSQRPSSHRSNDTTMDAKSHKESDLIFGTTIAIKNIELATKEEYGPTSALEEKTLSDKIATAPTLSSETIISLKTNKLENQGDDGATSAPVEKTLPDEITMMKLEGKVEVKKVELPAQEADEPTSALDYNTFPEEVAKPSVRDDSSAETADKRYLLKEEAKDSYTRSRILEDNMREKVSEVDQQQQSSNIESVTRDPPVVHEKKSFTWNLKSIAEGFMKIWRKS